MLIIALVLAAIGLAALVLAVVTSNALVAWVCIGASALGVLLLIVDALRERRANLPAAEVPAEAVEESEVLADDDDSADIESSDVDVVADFDAEAAEEAVDEPAAHSAD